MHRNGIFDYLVASVCFCMFLRNQTPKHAKTDREQLLCGTAIDRSLGAQQLETDLEIVGSG